MWAISSNPRKLDTWLQGNKHSAECCKTDPLLISTKQKHFKSKNKDYNLKVRDIELELVKETNTLECKSTAPWTGKNK